MKRTLITALVLGAVAFGAHAADATKPTAQERREATCAKQAGTRTGEARDTYVKDCLARAEARSAKMKQCHADAGGKKGDERKAFMKECLARKA